MKPASLPAFGARFQRWLVRPFAYRLLPALLALAPIASRGADYPALNDPATTEHFPGKFIWADLVTKDPVASEKFYAELFGWTVTHVQRPTPEGLHTNVIFSVGDRPVAGISHRTPSAEDRANGEWIGYISVPDVAKAVDAAKAGGGKLITQVRPVPARGTQAVITDLDGAIVGLMNSSSGDPGEYLPEPGDLTWCELFAKDPAAAVKFYETLAGYSSQPETRPGEPDHQILISGGFSRASVALLSKKPTAHPAWLLYVRVADVKAAAAKAVSLGGQVLLAPGDSKANYGRAVIADPNGAHLGLVELNVPADQGIKP